MVIMCCVCGMFGALGYRGAVSPDSAIYEGHAVPERFITTMKQCGALGEDEVLIYFYSSGVYDIRDYFCFLSHLRVVVYRSGDPGPEMNAFPVSEIESAELFRPESSLEYSRITMHLKDGGKFSFEVSSEEHRDEQFRASIERAVFLESLKPGDRDL